MLADITRSVLAGPGPVHTPHPVHAGRHYFSDQQYCLAQSGIAMICRKLPALGRRPTGGCAASSVPARGSVVRASRRDCYGFRASAFAVSMRAYRSAPSLQPGTGSGHNRFCLPGRPYPDRKNRFHATDGGHARGPRVVTPPAVIGSARSGSAARKSTEGPRRRSLPDRRLPSSSAGRRARPV